MIQLLWRMIWWFLTKLNILLYYLAIAFLGIYPNELRIYVHVKTCTQILIVMLLIIAKTWKQPRSPSLGEWVNWGTSGQSVRMNYCIMKRCVENLNAYH
jgi:hypothetical protein